MTFIDWLLSPDFMPHGHCYAWEPGIVWGHVISDAIIALAYFSIPPTLVFIALKRKDVAFGWVFKLFATFILACGTGHLVDIWNIWHGAYWLSACIRAVTAAVSIATAIALWPLMPTLLRLPSVSMLRHEVAEKTRARDQLRKTLNGLEVRVAERTRELEEFAQVAVDREERMVALKREVNELSRKLGDAPRYDLASYDLADSNTPEPSPSEAHGQPIFESVAAAAAGGDALEAEIESLLQAPHIGDKDAEQQRRAALNIAADAREAQRSAERGEAQAAYYRQLVANSTDAIISQDLDSEITSWNTGAALMFGYAAEHAIGRSGLFIVPSELHAEHLQAMQRLARGERIPAMDTERVRSDGESIRVSVMSSPVRSPEGETIGVSSVIRDMRAHHEAERRFRLAVEAAPAAMILVDSRGRIVLVNKQVERIFGYDRRELLDEPIERLIPKQTHDAHIRLRTAYMEQAVTRPMGPDRVLHALRKNGSEFPVEVELNPIETADGRFVLSAIIDISKRTRDARELKLRTDEMKQLLYTVSHDLKSPLVTIQGFASLIAESAERGEIENAGQFSSKIAKAARNLGHLIDDLLRLGRLEHGHDKIETLDTLEVLHEARDQLTAQFNAAGARLEVETKLPTIESSHKKLLQVFQNLLANALAHATTAPNQSIYVGYAGRGNHHEFYVRDEGPGIPEDAQSRIFEIFQRIERRGEGTGMGLAIVQKAAQTLGGEAWVVSKVGSGSSFYFTIEKHPQDTDT